MKALKGLDTKLQTIVSPFKLYVIVLAAAACGHLLILFMHDTFLHELKDLFMMLVVLVPVLYVFLYCPLKLYNSKLYRTARELQNYQRQLNNGLEHRVEENTDELAKAENRYRSLIRQSSDGICVWDPVTRKIQEANNQFLTMLGYTEEEMVKMNLEDIINVDSQTIDDNTNKIINEGETVHVRRRYSRKDGSLVDVETTLSMIKDGESKVCLVNVRDISERVQAEKAIKESIDNLKLTLKETVNALVSMEEKRDPYTAGHMHGVADLTRAIAVEMGLSEERVESISIAGTLHDIGKIYIPSDILSKPGKLTDMEMGIIKTHPQTGSEILGKIPFEFPVAEIILQHHERLNGSGYPKGLKEAEIMLEAKILAVADVVEAMGSHRPYRPAVGLEQALEEIQRNKGILYDPEVVEACLRIFREGYRLDGLTTTNKQVMRYLAPG